MPSPQGEHCPFMSQYANQHIISYFNKHVGHSSIIPAYSLWFMNDILWLDDNGIETDYLYERSDA